MNDDLISRTAAVNLLREKSQHYTVSMFLTSSECNVAKVVSTECAIEIFNPPAVEAEPVRHGRWIDLGLEGDFSWQLDGRGSCWRVYECSECYGRLCGTPKTNYCPKCGAKMDGGKSDGETSA